jgi:hypothetical protein
MAEDPKMEGEDRMAPVDDPVRVESENRGGYTDEHGVYHPVQGRHRHGVPLDRKGRERDGWSPL